MYIRYNKGDLFMDNRTLNFKITISILSMIASIIVFVLVILEFIGISIIGTGWTIPIIGLLLDLIWFAVATLNIIMYVGTKRKQEYQSDERKVIAGSSRSIDLTAVREKLAYLQKMKEEGLIADEEYLSMKASLVTKIKK